LNFMDPTEKSMQFVQEKVHDNLSFLTGQHLSNHPIEELIQFDQEQQCNNQEFMQSDEN
ncbi:10609_t:CDS:1, partial [Gigaspora rosea]